MRHLKTTFAVLGAVTVLVLAGNTIALATTGQALLLGKSNSANNITAITRTTAGSALKLQTASSASAPLTVNGTGKVAHLNADTVDGFDSATLKTNTRVYTKLIDVSSPADGFSMTTATVPSGTYLGSLNGWIYGPTSGTGLDCYFSPSGGGDLREVWIPVSAQGYYGIEITGVITLSTPQTVGVTCSGPTSTYSSYGGSPLQLALTRIDTVTNGTVAKVIAKRVARSGASAH